MSHVDFSALMNVHMCMKVNWRARLRGRQVIAVVACVEGDSRQLRDFACRRFECFFPICSM